MLKVLLAAALAIAPVQPKAVDPVSQLPNKLQKAIDDCRNAYVAFRYGKDGGKLLATTIARYPQDERALLVIVCAAYGDGFDDGKRGID
jgi:hypothetical protein